MNIRKSGKGEEASPSKTEGMVPVQEIAILGGGPASLSTAFHLTSQPDWQKRYSITIYQMGWRLGGKCASGRNAEMADRIEEHGIHVFGNFYKNVFDIVKKCNDETKWEYLPTKSMEDTFQGTFYSANILFLDNNRISWSKLLLPMNKAKPWEGETWSADTAEFAYAILSGMHGILTDHPLPDADIKGTTDDQDFLLKWATQVEVKLEGAVENILLSLVTSALKLFEKKGINSLQANHAHYEALLLLSQKFMHLMRQIFGPLIVQNVDHLSVYVQMDYFNTLLLGYLADGLYYKDLDTVDNEDWQDWLIRHGIDQQYTLPSPIVRAVVNTTFHNLDPAIPTSFSAASFLSFNIRLALGKGYAINKWIAGTGETIITPIYMCLKKRGVKFKFFHKVTALHKSGNEISAIDIDVQAHPIKGEYEPLRKLQTPKYKDPFYVWGSAPDLSQLKEKDTLKGIDLESYYSGYTGKKITLKKGVDFDQVVLGISIGALPIIAKEIINTDQKWQKMIENMPTAVTQSCQIWLDKSLKDLGFPLQFDNPKEFAIGATFIDPINEFFDCTSLIEVENWKSDNKPKSLIYVCGTKYSAKRVAPPLSDLSYPQREYDSTLNQTMQYFTCCLGMVLLPKATIPPLPTGFDSRHLICYNNVPGLTTPERMAQQYVRVNIEPTELYVLSFKGSAQHRLHAWESGISNLTLVGDWIYTGINCGAIEAAMLSGALGSFALTGSPAPENIQGYFFLHPDQVAKTKNVHHPLAKKK